MHGAQGAGCAPVATAFASGGNDVFPVRPTGIAKSLAIGNPADGVFAVGVARDTGGSIEAADDDEIVEGIRLLCTDDRHLHRDRRRCHHGDPPQDRRARRDLTEETVVAYITGDGLKTIDAIEPSVETVSIEADPEQVDAYIDARVTA